MRQIQWSRVGGGIGGIGGGVGMLLHKQGYQQQQEQFQEMAGDSGAERERE
jgi:hypothetical protein